MDGERKTGTHNSVHTSGTLSTMSCLVRLYDKMHYYKNGAAVGEQLCDEHASPGELSGTLEEMKKLATVYGDGGSHDKAAALMEKVCQIRSREAGEEEIHHLATRKQKSKSKAS